MISDDAPAVSPSIDTAIDGSYPIARPLLMYTAGQPTGPVGVYMEWILDAAGQCIILGKGYAPVQSVSCG
ncbi:MAG: phosphate-binding protein, partial [Gammaproteobacteria bacterium]|nr:phosphate-binding protein [Gammaproteobacteria bacterium]NIW00884.1 phosphate-binding protein [Gammaproteobacteria bacterium]